MDQRLDNVTQTNSLSSVFSPFSFVSLCFYNPEQNIWNKEEKSSKTGHHKKSLISTFACFLTAIAKV